MDPVTSLFGTPLPAGASPPPQIPGGEELYERIMGEIEPELTTAVFPTLKEKYKNENPQEAEARAKRYRAAFVEYEKRFNEEVTKLDGSVRAYHQTAIALNARVASQEDAATLTDIESQISTQLPDASA